jgi:hypothetical protein
VEAYNALFNTLKTSIAQHDAGQFMTLVEGNIGNSFGTDMYHGTHFMSTAYRNQFANGTQGFERNPAMHEANNRFMNWIGNVLGDPSFTAYTANEVENNNAIFQLGWATGVTDPNGLRTIMRWGNWDTVTGFTHWCGKSSDTNWASCVSGGWGYNGAASEIPSTITNFPNPIPTKGDTGAGQAAMPASFYLASKPSWWVFPSGDSSTPWPGIGPDVTGGNISNTGGHAYLNPAANCYLNVMGGTARGSSTPLTFNAGTCYPPAPPTDLVAAAD